jgi:hypothetical protein
VKKNPEDRLYSASAGVNRKLCGDQFVGEVDGK